MLWGTKPGSASDSVHIRVMGALAVGKTTLVSSTVTKATPKRSVAYIRSKHNQGFVCSVKGPQGEAIVVEMLDTVGNATAENIIQSESQNSSGDDADERKSLISRDDWSVQWCYLIMFDFTRHETYIHARKLIDRIRALELAQKVKKGTRQPVVIFLIGNKKEMCAAATLASWIRDQANLVDPKDHYLYVFTGSALDNSFVCSETPGIDKVRFIEATYKLGRDELSRYRLSIEQLIVLMKVRMDMIAQRSIQSEFFQSPTREGRGDEEDQHYKQLDDDETDRREGCCTRCHVWCCSSRRRKSWE